MAIDWALTASWAQAISSTVVLLMIYLQMRQVNQQMILNDEQERWRRSWEFVKFYREELRKEDEFFKNCPRNFEPSESTPENDTFRIYLQHYYRPRIPLFTLLNQLLRHQEVDERMLFGYLSDEFSKFVELGVVNSSAAEFRKEYSQSLSILLMLWGSQIKAQKILYQKAETEV